MQNHWERIVNATLEHIAKRVNRVRYMMRATCLNCNILHLLVIICQHSMMFSDAQYASASAQSSKLVLQKWNAARGHKERLDCIAAHVHVYCMSRTLVTIYIRWHGRHMYLLSLELCPLALQFIHLGYIATQLQSSCETFLPIYVIYLSFCRIDQYLNSSSM